MIVRTISFSRSHSLTDATTPPLPPTPNPKPQELVHDSFRIDFVIRPDQGRAGGSHLTWIARGRVQNWAVLNWATRWYVETELRNAVVKSVVRMLESLEVQHGAGAGFRRVLEGEAMTLFRSGTKTFESSHKALNKGHTNLKAFAKSSFRSTLSPERAAKLFAVGEELSDSLTSSLAAMSPRLSSVKG